MLLVGRFLPTKVIYVRYMDKPCFDDQYRHAFGIKQEVHLPWTLDHSRVTWEEFVCCQVRANETYSEANRQFSARNRDVLINSQSPYNLWSTPKSAVFGLSSSLPALVYPRMIGNRLTKLICSRIILTARSPGSLLTFLSLSIHLRNLLPLP